MCHWKGNDDGWRITENATLTWTEKVTLTWTEKTSFTKLYMKLLLGSGGYKSTSRGRELRHIGHTQWVAKSRSLGRLSGWGKNLGEGGEQWASTKRSKSWWETFGQRRKTLMQMWLRLPIPHEFRSRYIWHEVLVLSIAHLFVQLVFGWREAMKGSFSCNIYIVGFCTTNLLVMWSLTVLFCWRVFVLSYSHHHQNSQDVISSSGLMTIWHWRT
jgi:hypothetical protein